MIPARSVVSKSVLLIANVIEVWLTVYVWVLGERAPKLKKYIISRTKIVVKVITLVSDYLPSS